MGHWKPFSRKINGIKVSIFPPFLSGTTGRLTADFDINASPAFKIRNVKIPQENLAVPSFRTLPLCFENPATKQPDQSETNSFQIEIETNSENKADRIRDWLIPTAIRNLRRTTGQFWIGHPAIYFEGSLRAHYEVLNKKLNPNIHACSSIHSGNLRMQVLLYENWLSAWMQAKKEYDTDAFDNLLYAEHQQASGAIFDAISNCGLAIEKTKYALWEQLNRKNLVTNSEAKAARNDTQLPHRYFSDYLPETENSIEFSQAELDTIKTVWIARGLVAHGKETSLAKALGKKPDQERVNNWINTLFDIAYRVYQF
ncbi:hypothetical protein [Cognatishimia activa]|uniref:hypothetical protein n=1 Tax=Cognatishimia activa TaxID=1715691 RepID=UPI00222E67A7|nr:hypothetical protein [Cognatishimia activa]UZD91570.1 hypothetical protein M0D42_02855 [Cognatishimia activa]